MSAPWTAVRNTPNSTVRQNVARRGVIVHHPATTSFDLLRNLVMGGRQVSYTAIVNRGQAELIVPDARRPWSVANAYWDSRMRSVCLTNTTGAPGWHVHDETVWTAARAIAFWASAEGWWPHRDGDRRTWTVLGHGELRPIHGVSNHTQCPGGVPIGLLTTRAQQLMRGGGPTPSPLEEENMYPVEWRLSNGNGHLFLFGPNHVHHFGSGGAANYIRNLVAGRDAPFVVANDTQLTWILQAFDVPWAGVDQAMRGTAPGVDGKVWTRDAAAASGRALSEVTPAEVLGFAVATATAVEEVPAEEGENPHDHAGDPDDARDESDLDGEGDDIHTIEDSEPK